ncbi:unnamed protein product [Ectocarpus sp. 12 AP-2014]
METNRKAPTNQTTRLRDHRSRWARDAEQKTTVLRNAKLRIKDHQSRHDKTKKSRRILTFCPSSHRSSHFPQAALPPPKKNVWVMHAGRNAYGLRTQKRVSGESHY